ncbi:MAG: hypothetical protein A2735_01775 [Candidatus Yanofskybacteria bacterium RIFCSPHIGHO2_01_FULL_41_21]|uniref:Uncharacterized protein n=1 Tax=Candidatus Yanofskybacteria bacterium RIFCSPHIGHO2_01_FULL_41_21 TaxID=1802660 RepID=A0A1F8E9H7_9BACT|nr:MAG: hypothetical protein A2735_01775 [Candidatus Yanofskybacteria bacterium RIFCSPHIGHO2_01_FULL_41_21]
MPDKHFKYGPASYFGTTNIFAGIDTVNGLYFIILIASYGDFIFHLKKRFILSPTRIFIPQI